MKCKNCGSENLVLVEDEVHQRISGIENGKIVTFGDVEYLYTVSSKIECTDCGHLEIAKVDGVNVEYA